MNGSLFNNAHIFEYWLPITLFATDTRESINAQKQHTFLHIKGGDRDDW